MSKITWHTENQENLKHSWEKTTHRNQHQEDTDITAFGEFSDKDLKQVIKMFQQVKSNTLETNGKLENHSKEIKCRQMEILELKNVITKIENTLHRLNSRMESQWTWKTEQPKLPNINNREKNTEKEKNH